MNYRSILNIAILSSTFALIHPTPAITATPLTNWVTILGDAEFTNLSEATNSPQTTNASADVFMSGFPEIILKQGDTIRLSGSFTILGTGSELPDRQLRWGLFHTPEAPKEGQSTDYVGIWATASMTKANLARADGSTQNPFNSQASKNISMAIDKNKGQALYNKPLTFSISVKRMSDTKIQTSSMITDNDQFLIQWPETNSSAATANFTYNCAGFLTGGTFPKKTKALFSNIVIETITEGQSSSSNLAQSHKTDFRLFGIDFNSSEFSGAPTNSNYREISGKRKTSSPIHQQAGSIGVSLATADNSPIEFHGANGDASRSAPTGRTTRSALVADFAASRSAPLQVTLSHLGSGTYRWLSYHLEPIQKGNLGFASGISGSEPNTIQAHLGSQLQASVTPTALGSSGLNKKDITDSDIPTLSFLFTHDGSGPITIELSSTKTDGQNHNVFLNGFELYEIE